MQRDNGLLDYESPQYIAMVHLNRQFNQQALDRGVFVPTTAQALGVKRKGTK